MKVTRHWLVLLSLVACTTVAVGATNAPSRAMTKVKATIAPHASQTPSTRHVSITLNTGSLKSILTTVAKHYGWNIVVWQLPNDYQWIGHVTVQADNVPDLMRKILADFPVQAVFYQGNHVVVFKARSI